MSQRRMDLDQRPELQFGSVDFVVGKEYWVQENPTTPGASPREPKPLHYIFAIDVSWTSVRCGLIQEVVKGLRELLYPTEEERAEGRSTGLPAGAKIAIMTFDRTVQFFNLKVSLSIHATEPGQLLTCPSTAWTRPGADARRARYYRYVHAYQRGVPR